MPDFVTAGQQQLEALWLDIAMKSAPLNAELDEFIDKLDAEVFADTEADVETEKASLAPLDSIRAPYCYALYGVKYNDLASPAPYAGHPCTA